MNSNPPPPDRRPEEYFSVPNAAKRLGLKCYALRRAVNKGLVPSYTPWGGTRRMILLSEVAASISSFRQGGSNND